MKLCLRNGTALTGFAATDELKAGATSRTRNRALAYGCLLLPP
jgi:hypothetical protein